MSEVDSPMDAVVGRLQAVREAAGSPSYGDIAIGVSRVRRERGVAAERSRVGRTTVYDAFRVGRRRLDAELVTDIVLAVCDDEALAAELAEECRRAQDARPAAPVPAPVPAPDEAATDPDAGRPADAPADPSPPSRPRSPRRLATVLLVCVAANLLGRSLVDTLGLPLYLDMVGTAVSAVALGPWWGVLVALSTNVAGATISGPESLWFGAVNVVGALGWGYGARSWRLGRSVPHFFVLNLVVAVACTAVAVPILLLVYGGGVGHAQDGIVATVLGVSHSLWLSVLASNVLTSAVDKLFSGFVALTAIEALPGDLRRSLPATWMSDPPVQRDAGLVRTCSGSPEPA